MDIRPMGRGSPGPITVGGAARPGFPGFLSRQELLGLLPDEVRVLGVHLDSFGDRVEALAAVLSGDERRKAEQFAHEKDRRCYFVARGLLRHLLAGYLDTEPGTIRFSYGEYGKPELAKGGRGIHFNLSHAGSWVLYAFSKNRKVGIDIEPVRNEFPWESLEPMVFSAREQAEFALFPPQERTKAFLRGWTRKEAYLKGRGEGLSLPLNQVDVPLGADGNPALVFASGEEGMAPWWLYPIDPIPGCIAALAVEGGPARADCRSGH